MRLTTIRVHDYIGYILRTLNFGQRDGSLIAQNDFGPGSRYRPGPMFFVILLLYLIRKFPGLFGHPLTDWPGFFCSGLVVILSLIVILIGVCSIGQQTRTD